MKSNARIRFEELPGDYAALCQMFPPRPIHNTADYANTVEITDAMALQEDEFNRDQEDYFDLLCSLLEDYDAQRVKWPKVTGVEALKHLLEQRDWSAADLARLLSGSRNLGAMILRGERKLTLNHVQTLSRHFGVSADLFLDTRPGLIQKITVSPKSPVPLKKLQKWGGQEGESFKKLSSKTATKIRAIA